jgi:PAS domain S-box-containing protein
VCFVRVDDVLRVAARLTAVWAFSFVVGDDGVPKVEWTFDDVASQRGYSSEDLAEGRWVKLVIPEDKPAAEEALRTARDCRTASFELRVLNRKGKLRRIRGLIEGKPDPDSTIRRLIGAGHDVTERFETRRCQDLAVRVAHVLADSGSSDVAVVRLLEPSWYPTSPGT